MQVLTRGFEHCCARASLSPSQSKERRETQAKALRARTRRMSPRTIPELTLRLHWEKNVARMPRQSPTPSSPLSDAEPLLLASGLPRRREILANLGVPTLVTSVDVDESTLPG